MTPTNPLITEARIEAIFEDCYPDAHPCHGATREIILAFADKIEEQAAQQVELIKDVHALAIAANIARPDAQIDGPMALMLLYDVQKLMVEQREQNTKLRKACAAAHDWLWDREREEALAKLRAALEPK